MNDLIGQEKAWELLLKDRHDKIRETNVRTYNPDELQSPDLNLSVILKVPDEINNQIYQKFLSAVPQEYHAHLLFQNAGWYHLTLQWAPEKEIAASIKAQVLANIQEIVEGSPRIKGVVRFPYLADGGFLAGFFSEQEGEVALLKRKVSKVWDDFQIKRYLPDMYDETAYISQSRFLSQPDSTELSRMMSLLLQEVTCTFDKALVVLNDKIMTPERTQILEEMKLKA